VKKIVCPECGGFLGLQVEKGDPSYIDTDEIDTIRISVDGKTVFEIDVNDLKEQMATLVSICPHCEALIRPHKDFTFEVRK